jgi:hypothetical protein
VPHSEFLTILSRDSRTDEQIFGRFANKTGDSRIRVGYTAPQYKDNCPRKCLILIILNSFACFIISGLEKISSVLFPQNTSEISDFTEAYSPLFAFNNWDNDFLNDGVDRNVMQASR